MSWTAHAACRGLDPDLFHPEQGQDTRPAKKVCEGCPVRAECLDHAIRNGEVEGVWGGTSARQRRELRAAWAAEQGIDLRSESNRRPIKHGTLTGARRCYERPEGVCPACSDAWSRWMEYAPPRGRKTA